MAEPIECNSRKMTLRRLRQSPLVRELVNDVVLDKKKLIQPVFIVESIKKREPVLGLTGVFRETSEGILKQMESDLHAGINKFLLFCVPSVKARSQFDFSFTTKQIENIKKHFGHDVFLGVDVCLCSSTEHGHCGILSVDENTVLNDQTVLELTKAATEYAKAGADCVAPSDMMDGRIGSIRAALQSQNLESTLIMSYCIKFHSRFYGPFRVAADSTPKNSGKLKDRASYQIDPGFSKDAFLCAQRDIEEGADILMLKPGLPYLDILSHVSKKFLKPWAVYEVSGEYAAIEGLAEKGLMDARLGHLEAWTSLSRAGASMIITYGARRAKEWGL